MRKKQRYGGLSPHYVRLIRDYLQAVSAENSMDALNVWIWLVEGAENYRSAQGQGRRLQTEHGQSAQGWPCGAQAEAGRPAEVLEPFMVLRGSRDHHERMRRSGQSRALAAKLSLLLPVDLSRASAGMVSKSGLKPAMLV
jgi:hypothetical protein